MSERASGLAKLEDKQKTAFGRFFTTGNIHGTTYKYMLHFIPCIVHFVCMLQQENRLTRTKDFEILFKEGKFVSGQLATMKYWKVVPEKYPRRSFSVDDLKIGFVVSLKISKSAVKRNRAKRQMREVVRLLLKDKKIPHGYIISIMAKAGVLTATYAQIEQDVQAMLRRAGLLK